MVAKKTAIRWALVLLLLLVVTLLIIGICGTVVTRSNCNRDMRIEVLAFAISAYYDECKAYPPTSNGEDLMKVLEQSPSARKILENLPSVGDGSTRFVDRWGRPMRYSRDGGIGGFPLILSAGKDGKFGTADDIRSDAN